MGMMRVLRRPDASSFGPSPNAVKHFFVAGFARLRGMHSSNDRSLATPATAEIREFVIEENRSQRWPFPRHHRMRGDFFPRFAGAYASSRPDAGIGTFFV